MNGHDMNTISTRELVAGYLLFRLEKQNLPWHTAPDLPTPGKVQLTMQILGDEFEHRYNEVFQQMCNQLHITPNTARHTFVAVVNELFSDGVKWGRIVALFSFAGTLAVQCIEKEMPPVVDQIVDWVTNYVDNHLMSWILENDGWDGFVEFYEGRADRRNENPWPSFTKICGYAVGAVGVLTLGALFSQKS